MSIVLKGLSDARAGAGPMHVAHINSAVEKRYIQRLWKAGVGEAMMRKVRIHLERGEE
jgi:hypothetical protein